MGGLIGTEDDVVVCERSRRPNISTFTNASRSTGSFLFWLTLFFLSFFSFLPCYYDVDDDDDEDDDDDDDDVFFFFLKNQVYFSVSQDHRLPRPPSE